MFNVASIRQQFPALHRQRDGVTPIFVDGPAGTQVPQRVIDAVSRYFIDCNANHGGVFATSRDSDAMLDEAHRAAADFLNAPSPDEIVFGANMTTLTFHVSRSLGLTWKPGDEVIVTRLDHDANVRPWVLAARDAGATVRFVDFHPDDCTLDLDDLQRHLSERTRLVAVTCASNAVGTLTDAKRITQMARATGSLVFLDAVHYAPHGVIDVQDWGCDFLACSAYKFYGPHVGILWGKRPLLEELSPYKVRPATETLPGRWMTGTQNHEGIAGVLAAIEYLAGLGGGEQTRRQAIVKAMAEIRGYEMDLSRRLLHGLAERPRFRVLGVRDPNRVALRAPTVGLTARDRSATDLARHLAQRQIFTWNGNMYAQELTERLGIEDKGGLLRIGLVHYNTADEVDRVLRALDEL